MLGVCCYDTHSTLELRDSGFDAGSFLRDSISVSVATVAGDDRQTYTYANDLTKELAQGSSRRRFVKGLGLTALGGALALAGRGRVEAGGQVKQSLCYQTGDPANPFVFISVMKDHSPSPILP
ncbi:hypothetical protein BH23CHL5_BH23CHL5_26200 [soil metagenome]